MRHSILFAILSLFVAVSCVEKPSRKEVAKAPEREGWHSNMPKLRGDVESVTELEWVVLGTDTVEYKYLNKFNQRGDLEERKSFYSDGTPYDSWHYKYDTEGHLTEVAWYRCDGAGCHLANYEYDTAGKMMEMRETLGDGPLDRHIYKYDEQGRMTEDISCDDEGNTFGRVCIRYDSKGRKSEEDDYTISGTFSGKRVFTYDERGNNTSLSYYDENYRLWIYIQYKYDSLDNIIEVVDNNDLSRYQYKYDSVGNVVEFREYRDKKGTLSRIVEYQIVYRQK